MLISSQRIQSPATLPRKGLAVISAYRALRTELSSEPECVLIGRQSAGQSGTDIVVVYKPYNGTVDMILLKAACRVTVQNLLGSGRPSPNTRPFVTSAVQVLLKRDQRACKRTPCFVCAWCENCSLLLQAAALPATDWERTGDVTGRVYDVEINFDMLPSAGVV